MLQSDVYYHIFNHGNGDDNLFREPKNYAFFLKKCELYISPVAHIVAWCLMPNHFHLLVKIKSEDELTAASILSVPKFQTLEKIKKIDAASADRSKFVSKQFANFFSSYTQSFNKVYKRRGSLFIKNFKRKEIKDDNYLLNVIFYIHLNPMKHGFTKSFADWPHSSFFDFAKQNPDLFDHFFGDDASYRTAHDERANGFTDYDFLENHLT